MASNQSITDCFDLHALTKGGGGRLLSDRWQPRSPICSGSSASRCRRPRMPCTRRSPRCAQALCGSDPYLILGIPRQPPEQLDQIDVNRAFRARGRLLHPDRHCAYPASYECRRSATTLFPAVTAAHSRWLHPFFTVWRDAKHQPEPSSTDFFACLVSCTVLFALIAALFCAFARVRRPPPQRAAPRGKRIILTRIKGALHSMPQQSPNPPPSPHPC